MSDIRTDRDVEATLSVWMDQAAPTRPPTRLLQATFAETMGARQARPLPWNSIGIGSPRAAAAPTRMIVLLVIVALLVALLVAVGLGVGGRRLAILTAPSATPTVGGTASSGPFALPAALAVVPQNQIAVEQVQDIVASGEAIWALAPGRLHRIDSGTNTVADSVTIGSISDLYNGIAVNAAGVWVTNSTTAELDRIDPVTRKIVRIPAGLSPKGVLASADRVWVADVHGGSVLPVDESANQVGTAIIVGPTGKSGPNWLASGLGTLWVDVPNNNTIVRFDGSTGAIEATISAPVGTTPCGGIAVGLAAAWIPSCSSATTTIRVDPTTNAPVAVVEVGGYAFNPTLIGDAPWLSVDRGSADLGLLVRINPATNSIDRVLSPGPAFGGGGDIVVADGSVWVSDGWNGNVLRLPLAAFQP
jgi:hypothetical protein